MSSRLFPTHLAPGAKGIVVVQVYNIGAGYSNGTVTMTDALPPGLEATSAGPMTATGEISEPGVIE